MNRTQIDVTGAPARMREAPRRRRPGTEEAEMTCVEPRG